jgi:hemoglobin
MLPTPSQPSVRVRSLTLLLVLAALLVPSSVLAQGADADEASLYQRVGGYDMIAAVVDDFLGRFGTDPELAPFLGGVNASEGARVRQRFVDFACAQTGGPCLYLGRDMESAHEGLGIRAEHFDRVLGHMRAAIEANGVPDEVAGELVALFEAQRSAIVRP